jgi:hypothetical protein
MQTNERRILVCLRCERFEECDGYIETGMICTPVEVYEPPDRSRAPRSPNGADELPF